MRKFLTFPIIFSTLIMAITVMLAAAQNTGVVAEAVGTANLRAGIGTDTDVVGTIQSGIRYPVIGRSAQFPWLLLGDIVTFAPIGWVYTDLVSVSGIIESVPISEINVLAATATPFPTLTPVSTLDPSVPTSTLAPTLPPTATQAFNVYGNVQGEINLRYGPGADYARLGGAFAGDRLEIVAYHVTLPWVQVVFPGAPNDVAWVSREVIEIVGDISTTRPITQTNFANQPTLTPTPAVQQQSSVSRGDVPPVVVSQEFASLGNAMWDNVLARGFDPTTSKFAAMYLRNIKTGEEITFGNQYAFSGTSISKIAILAGLFSVVDNTMDMATAGAVGNTIICSDNTATNAVLARIGGGDMYAGAELTTRILNEIGLRRSFLTAPFAIQGQEMPQPTSPVRYPRTDADQVKANPDITNQMTVDETGFLLEAIYECAFLESGPLMTKSTAFTPQECRKILYVLENNTVDAFAKAGAPEGTVVAHKHGWIGDTHGNAALVFTPGGDYILVMMVFEPEWLVFEQSFALIAETSRMMYNYLNPDAPLAQVRDGVTPETQSCNYNGSELAENLASPYFLEINTGRP